MVATYTTPSEEELADALDEALELLGEFLPETHVAYGRLSGVLCRANVGFAAAHVRSQGLRQWIGGAR
ncbi:hypothetical protein UFOVP152_41 [uncultured Caudovirales phage]|uniref:Uncharacterized protein n=1 Tax=uncultured Caudovirales phage TaxID=2100421 RepID=A0A6J7WCG3_9CAUD|nr:hypothetical protein UFOVP152_41 [uncultured Caudovirales phage]